MDEEEQLRNDAELLQQFRRLFAPIVNDSLQLYYQLNEDDADNIDSDDVQHIRIHSTVAELLDLTSSEEETLVTQLNSPLSKAAEQPTQPEELEQELKGLKEAEELVVPPQPVTPSGSSMSSTSSSCLYAIHTPVPSKRVESPLSVSSDPLTLTEQVLLHAPPLHSHNHNSNNNEVDGEHQQEEEEEEDAHSCSHNNNNNTSCSLSSTFTDSKTLDARTPIVV